MMLKLLYASLILLYVCSVFAQIGQEEANLLRILIVSDWGKGGNTGTYMSSYNFTERSLSVADSSDWFDSSIANVNNVSLLGENKSGGGSSGSGTSKSLFQPQVAKAMGTYAAKSDPAPSFVLSLGDNFYINGVSSATDVLWNYLWKDVYHGYAGLKIPWYPIFGNHDYGGNVQAQLDRTKQNTDDDYWQFPSSNYSKIFEVPGGEGATVGIVFVDTTTLAPSINKCCNENGGVSVDEQARRINNQLFHIDRMLSELTIQNVTWLLVAGHYPIFSAGSDGDSAELQAYLLPLLEKYHVQAYLCGHDHISEHMQAQNIEFFVAGAGSMTDKLVYQTRANLTWGGGGYSAFGFMDVTANYLTFGIIDIDNVLQYQYTMMNPRPLRRVTPDPDTADPAHDDHHNDDRRFSPILPVEPPAEDNGSNSKGMSSRTRQIVLVSGSLLTASGLLIALLYFCYGREYNSSKAKVEDAKESNAIMGGKVSRSVNEGRMTQPTTTDSDDDEEKGNLDCEDYDESESIDEDSLAGTINPLPVFHKNRTARVCNIANQSQKRYRKKRRGYHPGARYRSKDMYNALTMDDISNSNGSISTTSESMVLGSDFEPQPLSLVAGTLPFIHLSAENKHDIHQQHGRRREHEKAGLTKVVHVPGYHSQVTVGTHRRVHSASV